MRLCDRCLKHYKHSRAGKAARVDGGAWGSGRWPSFVYHAGPGRLCEKHLVQRRADSGHRRAAELQQTPPWADRAAIKAVYAEARRLERETGRKYHVDHIVPLQGERVSGLHVAANLQALPAGANVTKGNRFTV